MCFCSRRLLLPRCSWVDRWAGVLGAGGAAVAGVFFLKAVAVCLLCCCVFLCGRLWLLVCQWVGRGRCFPCRWEWCDQRAVCPHVAGLPCWEVGIRLAVCVLRGLLLPRCAPCCHAVAREVGVLERRVRPEWVPLQSCWVCPLQCSVRGCRWLRLSSKHQTSEGGLPRRPVGSARRGVGLSTGTAALPPLPTSRGWVCATRVL